jgi:hypothetical protein
MIEGGVRGGVSMITTRHARANNPYIKERYDPNQPNVYLGYFDMNNLYGGAMVKPLPKGDFRWLMVKPLPKGDFRWLCRKEISDLDIMNIQNDAATEYILEVTLDYPDHHNDLPLAAQSLSIKVDDLSPYCLELFKKLHKAKTKGEISKKLVPTLDTKTKYVVHYRNLQFYIAQGLVLKEIHRVISFKQSAWLKPYIEYNTRMRREAQNEFEVSLYKAYNNIVFG